MKGFSINKKVYFSLVLFAIFVLAVALYLATKTKNMFIDMQAHHQQGVISHASHLMEIGMRSNNPEKVIRELETIEKSYELSYALLFDKKKNLVLSVPEDAPISQKSITRIFNDDHPKEPYLKFHRGNIYDKENPDRSLGYYIIAWSTQNQEEQISSIYTLILTLCSIILLPTLTLIEMTRHLTKSTDAKEEAERLGQFLTDLLNTIPDPLFVLKQNGTILRGNAGALAFLGVNQDQIESLNAASFYPDIQHALETASTGDIRKEVTWGIGEDSSPILMSIAMLDSEKGLYVCKGSDLGELKNMEMELAHARKMESVGTLAAGIAHEINTPIQFIGDNLRFLKHSFGDVIKVIKNIEGTIQKDSEANNSGYKEILEHLKGADMGFLGEEIPNSLDQSLSGMNQVASIVQGMKAFSHPGNMDGEMHPLNINENIQTTTIVSRNEYKYVATLTLDLQDDLPLIKGDGNILNQVFLNMVTNAAHAIEERFGDDSQECQGTILIRSWSTESDVRVSITDNGKGIPEEIQDRLFDTFFTTKEVGKGTGQGLSVAWDIICNKHGGRITVDSTLGEGTTFTIIFPVL